MAVNVTLPDGTVKYFGDEEGRTICFRGGVKAADSPAEISPATDEIVIVRNGQEIDRFPRNEWASVDGPS